MFVCRRQRSATLAFLTSLSLDVKGRYGFTTLSDFYRLSIPQLQSVAWFPARPDFLHSLLSTAYPSHSWEASKFSLVAKKAHQHALVQAVKLLLADTPTEILEDFRSDSSSASLELDLYLPSLSLGFELQGEQHYRDVTRAVQFSPDADDSKAAACARLGITLVCIPFTWAGSRTAIYDAVVLLRPDLSATFLRI